MEQNATTKGVRLSGRGIVSARAPRGRERPPRRIRLILITALGAAAIAAGLSQMQAPEPSVAKIPATPAAAALALAMPASAAASEQAPPRKASVPLQPGTTPGSAKQIGAEGYGPHIERAHAGTDPQAAWDAVLWLRQCASIDSRRDTATTLRDQGLAPEFMTQRIVEVEAEARRCQTVTTAHRALIASLAARAMRAGKAEAAAAYAEAAFPADLTPQERAEVAEGLRRDAQGGQETALMAAASASPAWGLSDDERLKYLFALTQMPKPILTEETALRMIQLGEVKLKSPPSPAQVAALREAGRAMVERLRLSTPQ